MAEYYYLDTCIWLNLFKKEGDPSKGKPYWEIANELIDYIKKKPDSRIIISSPILKELKFKLREKFAEKRGMFMEEGILFAESIDADYKLARRIESENHYQISFYDCLNISLARRLKAILVTRDKKLLDIGKRYADVSRPEDLKSKFFI